MSFNRDNVEWQSADGTWNLGFFEVVWEGDEADGEDPEWDVEYDMTAFEWVTTGHRSQQAARNAWRGANPGGSIEVPHSADTATETATYDRMASALRARQDQARTDRVRQARRRIPGWVHA